MSGSQSENDVPGWMWGALGTGLAGAAGGIGHLAYNMLRNRAPQAADAAAGANSRNWFSSMFGDSALRDRIAGASRPAGGAGAGGSFGQAVPPTPPRPDFVVDSDGVARRPRAATGPAFGQAGLNAGADAAQAVRAAAGNTWGTTLRNATQAVRQSPITRGVGLAGLAAGTAGGVMDALDEQSAIRRAIDQGRDEAAQRLREGSPIAAATTFGAGLAQGGLHAANNVVLRPVVSMFGAGRLSDLLDRGIAQLGPGRNAPPLPARDAATTTTMGNTNPNPSRGNQGQQEAPTYHGRNLPFPTAPRSAPGPNGEWNGPSDQDMLRVHNERIAQRERQGLISAMSPEQYGQYAAQRLLAQTPRPRQATARDMAGIQAMQFVQREYELVMNDPRSTPQQRAMAANNLRGALLGVAGANPGALTMGQVLGLEPD